MRALPDADGGVNVAEQCGIHQGLQRDEHPRPKRPRPVRESRGGVPTLTTNY